MRRLFLFVFLMGLIYGGFTYQNTHVKIYPDIDGNAHVVEEISILINDENSAKVYDSNIGITNDIGTWKSRTNVEQIRYHINPNIAPIENLRITPLPKKRLSIINPSYEGVLRIEYDAKGLFNKTMVKPRTYYYTLKPHALMFSSNAKGDLVLEDSDYLYIILSKDTQAVSVDPIAQNIDILTPDDREFMWRGKTILEDFSFVYKYEISLRDEVEEYFDSLKMDVIQFITSKDGAYLFAMIFIISVSYFILKDKVNSHGQQN